MHNIDKFTRIAIKFVKYVSKIVQLTGMDVLDQYIWSKNKFIHKMVEFRGNNFTCFVYGVQLFQLEKAIF